MRAGAGALAERSCGAPAFGLCATLGPKALTVDPSGSGLRLTTAYLSRNYRQDESSGSFERSGAIEMFNTAPSILRDRHEVWVTGLYFLANGAIYCTRDAAPVAEMPAAAWARVDSARWLMAPLMAPLCKRWP